MKYGQVRGRPEDLAAFSSAPEPQARLPRRIDLDPEKVERGLLQLVLSIIELLRQLLEKQALRRIAGGELSGRQVEDLGITLMRLEQEMAGLKEHFQIDDLNLDLGPLGNLLDGPSRPRCATNEETRP